jgi:perosamine synthetase
MAGTSPLVSIPMSPPDITELEVKAVVSALKDGYKNPGLECARFEELFQEYYGVRFAIGVNSSTAGLHLGIRASGITSGDIVITTPFSDISSISAILYENAIPVFVDIEPGTGAMNLEMLSQVVHDLVSSNKLSRRWLPRSGAERIGKVKALLPGDTFGLPINMEVPVSIANEYKLKIIEDASGAFGAWYLDHRAGTCGNFGVFSFRSGNQLSTYEGGMVITGDEAAANLIRALRNEGSDPQHQNRLYNHLGYNYQLNELNAALGRAQMTRIEDILHNREQVALWYITRLANIPAIEIPIIPKSVTRAAWPAFVIRLDPSIYRQNIIEELAIQGIPSAAYSLPIHLQPFMVERFGYRAGDFSETEMMARRVLALPFSGSMTEKQVDSICKSLKQILS